MLTLIRTAQDAYIRVRYPRLWRAAMTGATHDHNNRCVACGAHLADPHAPACLIGA